MRMHEALLYLPHIEVDPALRVKCPTCRKPFTLANGIAAPAVNKGEPMMAFFCQELCWLEAIPPICCGSA